MTGTVFNMPRLETAAPDWRMNLARRGERVIGDERNVLHALRQAPELRGLVRFNQFALRVELTRSPPWRTAEPGSLWTDTDDIACKEWLQGNDIPVSQRGIIPDCIELIAAENKVHPVRQYLGGLRWDGTPRLNGWLVRYLCAAGGQHDDTDLHRYLALVGRKFLISAVARIYSPGCQADHVLVIEGPQGARKSSAVRALAVQPGWCTDRLPDIRSKDAQILLCGRWLIELAELAALRRAEVESMKAYITAPVDHFRPPYGRRTVDVPRQCVFIATTNEARYLRDPTGNRRFWPVSCGLIDTDSLTRDRDQLWAEAVHAYQQAETWHLGRDEERLAAEEQRERTLTTELESDVAEYLHGLLSLPRPQTETDVRSVLIHALNLDPDKPDFTERALRLGAQVATAMERSGWARVKRTGRGENRRTLYRYQDSPVGVG